MDCKTMRKINTRNCPTSYQRERYNDIINQLRAAGVEPYEAVEDTTDAYKCITKKNIDLAFQKHVKIEYYRRDKHD